MQFAVLHGCLSDDAEHGPFVERLRIDIVRRFERGVCDVPGDDYLLINISMRQAPFA